MLDEISIKILEYIKDNSPADTKDIDSLVSDVSVTKKHIHTLQNKKYITGLTIKPFTTGNEIKYIFFSPYEITPDGLAYLESIKKQKHQEKWDNFHK